MRREFPGKLHLISVQMTMRILIVASTPESSHILNLEQAVLE